MNGKGLAHFYTDDHRRLDAVLEAAAAERARNPENALSRLAEFQTGLEQHMAWEETILFPAFDQHFPASEGESVTEALLGEHSEILDALAAVVGAWRENRDASGTEKRLRALLAEHNRLEEKGVYVPLDAAVTDGERGAIFRDMKASAFN